MHMYYTLRFNLISVFKQSHSDSFFFYHNTPSLSMLLYNDKCITSDQDASTDKLMGFSSSSAQNTIKNCIDFQIETMIAY